MRGAALVFSRKVNLHDHFKTRFEELGYSPVSISDADKDGMISLINGIKPRMIIIPSDYWGSSTPYKIGELHKRLPKIRIVIINMVDYSTDKACGCIINGATSYVDILMGLKEFYYGLNEINEGRDFISSVVAVELKNSVNENAQNAMTPTEIEVISLHYKGHENSEIAELLFMAVNTVLKHKRNIKNKMNTNNTQAAVYNSILLGLIDPYEKNYFPNSIMAAKKERRGRLRQENKAW